MGLGSKITTIGKNYISLFKKNFPPKIQNSLKS